MSRKRSKERIVIKNVNIEAVAAEGNGLAHIDGKVLFVPKCVPGNIVDVVLTRSRKGFMQGNLINMVKESPIRQKPFCPHYGICGGCTWQALPYDKQLEFKQQQIADQFTRIGHLSFPPISPILGSERIIDYRNKLEFTFSDRRWLLSEERFNQDGTEKTFTEEELVGLGFHIPQKFSKILDISECRLQKEPSNAIRMFVRRYAIEHGLQFFDLYNHTGLLRNLMIRSTEDGQFMVNLVIGTQEIGGTPTLEDKKSVQELLTALCAAFPQIISTYIIVNNKANDSYDGCTLLHHSGAKFITEKMGDLTFRIGPKSFYQTNASQAYRLYSTVCSFADPDKEDILYDLYTGTGTIALFLARKVRKVIGIEYVEEAVADAKKNAADNGITNVDFFAGDMKDILNKDFIRVHGAPNTIILDPPRAGIHPSVAQVIIEASPNKIVYVSCNPASQARDLEILCRHYSIRKVQPVDMFPHTQHLENIVILQRNDKCYNTGI